VCVVIDVTEDGWHVVTIVPYNDDHLANGNGLGSLHGGRWD
jgi:hypothetical protein